MKKYVILGLLMVLLTACGSENVVENSKKYEDNAQRIIEAINLQDYNKLKENSDEEFNKFLTEEIQNQITKDIGSKGQFKDFGSSKVILKKSQDKLDKYFVVIKEAEYENGKVIYTISFDEDDKLCGLYYK